MPRSAAKSISNIRSFRIKNLLLLFHNITLPALSCKPPQSINFYKKMSLFHPWCSFIFPVTVHAFCATVTDFADASARNRQNPLPPFCIARNFQFRKFLPVYSNIFPCFSSCNLPQYCYNWIQYRYTRKGELRRKEHELFEERIAKDGVVKEGKRIKVDSFKPSDGYRTFDEMGAEAQAPFCY